MIKDRQQIRLVVFDLAGTIIDHGCFGPVAPFTAVFRGEGVEVTPAQARKPMGLNKRDHILAMARIAEIAEQWRMVNGREFAEADLDRLYKDFVGHQLAEIPKCSQLISGVKECVERLREGGIRIATTTGYFREAAELVYRALREQGLETDYRVCAEDVPEGRPAPWMIYQCMQGLGIYPPSQVLKIGDTVPDILAGRNAACWSIGITSSSSLVGLSESDLEELSTSERAETLTQARQVFEQAGAHAVLGTINELSDFVLQLTQRLADGERP